MSYSQPARSPYCAKENSMNFLVAFFHQFNNDQTMVMTGFTNEAFKNVEMMGRP
jgi:hypothetical protein